MCWSCEIFWGSSLLISVFVLRSMPRKQKSKNLVSNRLKNLMLCKFRAIGNGCVIKMLFDSGGERQIKWLGAFRLL